ncbi:serine aminopeptidase, s33 domain-containing protein [Ditylenchus destructor]|nr:serine aminopeptidase, s33 domain-containing protein [Ditylenchus destructor]
MSLHHDVILVLSGLLTLLYVVLPLLCWYCPQLMHHMFFLNYVHSPFMDYMDLSLRGVRYVGRNFYLEKDGKTTKQPELTQARIDSGEEFPRIGVWHILPASVSRLLRGNDHDDAQIEQQLDSGAQPVIIYFHGNTFDRASKHRCELYNVLASLDYHVLAIDYRGYGDSSGTPTEDGLIEDAHTIYKYARSMAPSKDIFIWGHSMGTGVATRVVAELCDAGQSPEACILEAPFNNLVDAVKNHPFSAPFKFLPWFYAICIEPLLQSGLCMSSDKNITRIKCPILILHAADDAVIPVELGRKLVECARKAKCNVTYKEFEAERQLMHNYIHRSKELRKILSTEQTVSIITTDIKKMLQIRAQYNDAQ